MSKISKKWYWIGSILIVLIAARLAMPYFVTRHVNKVLTNLEGYRGSIYDVDIHLYRGAYSIDSLKIFKIHGNKEVPFVDIPVTDLSVEWSALFDGAIVGEVIFDNPALNFIADGQSGEGVDWTGPLRELMPLKINRLEIQHGTINFHNFTTEPKVSVSLNDLDALAINLNNAADQFERLPSTISASATSIGGGKLSLSASINVLKEIPDLDLDMKFEKVNMPALNDFFMAYAKVDVEKGAFNLYSEVTIDSGIVAGYVKPIAVGVKVADWKKGKEKPLNLLCQSFVALVAEVFGKQKEDQFATKVPLEGNLNNSREIGVWPSVWNIFSNAFVKAFEQSTDNSVEFVAKVHRPETKREERERKRGLRRENKKKKTKSI
jgi:hypothetical protein